ncbi:putative f-box domain protein [Rosellinia necatrix]|uniref:Putative f-box domain protein n=1 Tax=Rosellinia necatrix TaxID=77044 RepID=A0A1S8A9Y6_ROSNE|nr:putative f-box domain protein [Rosellinia necatrix]
MPLITLPSEILDQVVRESIPESFENLTRSCRALYECGRRYAQQHQARKERYHRMGIGGCSDASWLAEFAEEPRIPHYTSTLDLRWPDGRGPENGQRPERDNEYKRRRVEALIRQSPYLSVEGVDPDFWVDMIMSDLGDHDNYSAHNMFLGIFYLTFFPNVVDLTLPWSAPGSIPYHDRNRATIQYELVLNAIARESRSEHNRRALGKVKRLRYLLRADYDIRQRLQFLLPLLTLPELEELHANSLTAVDFHEEFVWTYSDIYSNLRTIKFTHCCMDSVGISALLAHTPYLTSFEYKHMSKHHGMEAYWDAGQFVAAIEKQVGSQLQHLVVTVGINSINGISAGVTSLRGFTKLETLGLDLLVFYGPSVESGEKAGILNTPPNPGFARWTTRSIPPLRNMLPASVREFKLLAHSWKSMKLEAEAMIRLYGGLRSARSSCFQNLDQCSVRFASISREYIPRIHEMRKRLEAEGVQHSTVPVFPGSDGSEWEI